VDGIKIFLEDAAILFLPDRERTFFHVNIEAKNQSRADGLLEEYAKLVEKWI
jgi:phosphomannomutase